MQSSRVERKSKHKEGEREREGIKEGETAASSRVELKMLPEALNHAEA